jgi:hydroxypyruvate isomerase
MLRFCANTTALYPGLGLLDSLAQAARDGFDAVEMRFPHADPPLVLGEALRDLRLTLVQFNLTMGDFAAGERGIACLPGREEEFRAGVERALEWAVPLGVRQLNCPAGIVPTGADPARCMDALAGNLRHAAERLVLHGIRLQLEPVNRRDMPGAIVATTAEYEDVAVRVGSDNLFLQYDFYHMQIMQGDLVPGFLRLLPRINHLQVADTPGRHEPGTGEINYAFVLGQVARSGYAGWIGLEYAPATKAAHGLGWMQHMREHCQTNLA